MKTNKADVVINPRDEKTGKKFNGILLISAEKWYLRLWFLITNIFRYLLTGKIRY